MVFTVELTGAAVGRHGNRLVKQATAEHHTGTPVFRTTGHFTSSGPGFTKIFPWLTLKTGLTRWLTLVNAKHSLAQIKTSLRVNKVQTRVLMFGHTKVMMMTPPPDTAEVPNTD